MRAEAMVYGAWRRPISLVLLEEGSELGGALAFACAHAVYAHGRIRQVSNDGRIDLTITPRWYLTFAAVLVLGVVAVHILIPHLMYLGDDRGVPQNWFPAVAALVVSALVYGGRRAVHGSQWALTTLALILFLLAIDHAAAFAWQDRFLSTERIAPWLRDIVMAGVLGAVAVAAARALPIAPICIGIAFWVALLVMSEMQPLGVHDRVNLALAGYLALGLGWVLAPRATWTPPDEQPEPSTGVRTTESRRGPGQGRR
jgi:hypothetical protein